MRDTEPLNDKAGDDPAFFILCDWCLNGFGSCLQKK
jgi:hypothetical protein